MTRDDAIELVTVVINREGGLPGSSLHSWRCEYPLDQEGSCGCVEGVADEIVLALLDAGVVL